MSRTSTEDRDRRWAAALRYAAHGWPVVPLASPAGQGCSCPAGPDCSSIGKHPRTRDGLYDAATDPDQITRWWHQWPDANIGIVTDQASGIVVLDIDLPDGPTSLAQLQHDHGTLPPTLTQRTGSGGWQLVFTRPDGGMRNRAGMVAGIDVRGDGGYIVVPPSMHACGDRYRWTDRTPPAPPPNWLIDKIRPPTRPPFPEQAAAVSASVGDRYGRAALAGELSDLARAPEGTRNHTLNRAAFRLGQLVGAGLLDDDLVRRRLTTVAQQIGLGAREATRTISSGMTAGMKQPRPLQRRATSRA